VRKVFCPVHGITPCWPSDPERCCYGCRISTNGDGPEVA